MSLLSENIIPGNHGKIFGANAKDKSDLEKIKTKILSLKGVKDVLINSEVYLREFTVHTTGLVKVADIEAKVQLTGFHAIPKGLLKL